jgi:hypothetical protein
VIAEERAAAKHRLIAFAEVAEAISMQNQTSLTAA